MARDATVLIQLQGTDGAWVDVGLLRSQDERNSFDILSTYWEVTSRPVLGQVFEEHGRGWRPSAYTSLPKWFSHLLPEGRLRNEVARASDTNKKREFELLVRLGYKDLPGAVRALPADHDGIVHPDAEDDTSNLTDDPLLKFSLAGVQLKFSVYGNQRGLTVPASGSVGNVILKFPDGREGFDAVPEAELGCLRLSEAAGISACEAWLVSVGDVDGLESWARQARGKALAVQRFDRASGDQRIHMEELAQILDIPVAGDRAKYMRANFETVASVLGALAGPSAIEAVIDQVVLNVLVGNGDAHLKNWAVTYPDGTNPALSPAFDIVPTVLYLPEDDLGLKLNGSRLFGTVAAASFHRLGQRSGYGGEAAVKRASESASRILDVWPLLGEYLSVANFALLNARLDRLPLYREVRASYGP